MSQPQLEIQLVALVVAAACALPGVFLVLRRLAMLSDAISHAILPGIVVGFFLTDDLNAPLLIVAAAATGVLTVVLVELLNRTRLVKEDAAIGLVFPALFSLGVLLIARYADDVHLDTDAVLLGELAFAYLDRFEVAGLDLGPKALITGGVALLLNATFIALFYKELKLSTFDARLAATLGFAPTVLHYAQMTLVSVTAVVSFDAVGSVLVIALMIGPAATAYLLTDRLDRMLYLSVGIAVLGALLGYNLARVLDASIAGSMAACIGLVFGLTYLLAPERGLLAIWQRRRTQRWHFATKMLTIHLQQHEGEPEQDRECHVGHLQEHFRWQASFADRVVQQAQTNGFVQRQGDALHLTEAGRLLANEAVVNRR